jgi:uncharacterized RDD family membrane protein YckC
VVFLECSLLTGVEASAAQNLPVTKTCLQCGAILPSRMRACHFCDSSFSVSSNALEGSSDISARENQAFDSASTVSGIGQSGDCSVSAQETPAETAWRGELTQRLRAYRTRRRKRSANDDQSQFSFQGTPQIKAPRTSIAIEEPSAPVEDDFSFTIAIGRSSRQQVNEKSPMEIDVSLQPEAETRSQGQPVVEETQSQPGLYPVALIDDRQIAAVIDLVCLLFAYGGFLGLFGSLGGHFTLSKLSVAVCASTFAIVYLQYFALFTIFGGTTPGMMMRGLQVVSFSGDAPTPKQMLLRSAGYMISAGTFFLGFLWAMWDEDELTWHDRLSRTYLSAAQTLADIETSEAAHSR